jgi:glycosyltransferase involved in cell wall biosynthesis
VYGLAETFVFPSIYEGFGLPPVEASLAGTRVICSDIPCLKEIMGNAATYYKLGDVGELAKKLEGPSSVLGELPRTYSWHTSAELLYKALELHYG